VSQVEYLLLTTFPVRLDSLSAQQLSQLKKQLDGELEHLTTSYQSLVRAQAKFRDCLKSISTGLTSQKPDTQILVPLTSSLYVPGKLADVEKVIVDVGTGFYVEKTTSDATKFYETKVEELGANLKDLGKIVEGKEGNVRVIEDALRQKVMSGQNAQAGAEKEGT